MKRKHIKASCILFAASLFGAISVRAQVDSDSVVNVAFGSIARKDLTDAVSTINVSALLDKSYGVGSLDNLQSLLSGYTGNIWGQAPLVLVDGIPRRAQDIRMVEIETISMLKGANAVVLYGSNAAKGVILITTKRGTVKPLSIDVRLNSGVFTPKGYPKYLNAGDYMTLYNEAYVNDGLATAARPQFYTDELIANTKSGTNPFRYPDIDFFSSDYLKSAFSRSDLTTEISGGNERSRYYTNIGLNYNNSIMNFGDQKNNNDFGLNIRANVDMNLTKWLTASTDVVTIFNNNYAGRGDFWGASANRTPNFNNLNHPLIPISMLDLSNDNINTLVNTANNIIDGKYILGGNTTSLTNQLADMVAAGYIKTKNRTFLYNVNAKADLSGITKGLSIKVGYGMDYTSTYSEAFNQPYAVYAPTWSTVDGKDMITDLRKLSNDGNTLNENIGRTTYRQTQSFTSQLNYNRSFNKQHNFNAALVGWWYLTQFSSDPDNEGGSSYHPIRNSNLGFKAGYNFSQKYYIDFASALVHSAKLPPGGRQGFSPAVTLGWRISDEGFFKNKVSFIDDLKLTASWASVKQDLDITGTKPNTSTPTDYFLYQGYYGNSGALSGWYQWRDGVSGGNTTMSGQGENSNLTFITRNEYRAGINASLLKGFVTLDANYFLQDTKGLLSRGVTVYPSFFTGNGDFRNWLNFNNDRRNGVDFSVNLNKKVGQVQLSLGVVGMFYSSTATRRDEVQPEEYMNRSGKNLDAFWGYIADGLFQSQSEIDNHASQKLGSEVRPGDIKYRDMNNDGIIDSRDQVDLGKNGWAANPFNYGLNLTVKWKNLTLFAMGSGQSGAIGFKNSSYFWVRGTSKFSDEVWGRWTENTKNTATFPRLTTGNGNNNYQNSTFWMYKNNRFNLNRVQLTYDFKGLAFLKKSFVHGMSIYAQGDNLLVLSKERELMETNVGSAPQYRFYNFGVRATF
jgi:TonB-linked SusC/RagA family outer membrane protein